MTIERQNVLELIGANRSKYHSCVITCYAFDFAFFEERMLPVLRTANIRNVNVLTDANSLGMALEHTSGKEFKQHKTYSIFPIQVQGCFHPKIMLLTGPTQGLLIIGSGNLTSSGISTNDEIWGAFHIDSIERKHSVLFGQVWEYLSLFLIKMPGFNQQKIEWITKYSPWLLTLVSKKVRGPIALPEKNCKVSFLCNDDNTNLYTHLKNSVVHRKKLKAITIVSPYYDSEGIILTKLFSHFKPDKLTCIVDDQLGSFPTYIKPAIKKNISFYRWSDCGEDFDKKWNRLHAKLLHFQYEDSTEFLFFGSANCSVAAFGTSELKHMNEESGLLLERNSKTNYLAELGIRIPKKEIDISSLKSSKANPEEAPRLKRQVSITYCEIEGSAVKIYVSEKLKAGLQVSFYSAENEILENILIEKEESPICLSTAFSESVHKVCISKSQGNRISNFSLIHNVNLQSKSNPDPNQQKLNEVLDIERYSDGTGLSELLAYMDYSWADEDDHQITHAQNRIPGAEPQKHAHAKEYETLTSDKFNKVSAEVLSKQTGELTSANVRIAEFLHMVGAGLQGSAIEDFDESEEQRLFEEANPRGLGEEAVKRKKTVTSPQAEIRAICTYFKKLDRELASQMEPFYESMSLTKAPTRSITIKNISNLLVGLSLIQLYYGKKFIDERLQKSEFYLKEGRYDSHNNDVKGFLIQTLGKFLLLSTSGFKSYDYEILNNKINELRKQFCIKAILAILNVSWATVDQTYRDTLILNLLHFVLPDRSRTFAAEFQKELNRAFSLFEKDTNYLHSSYRTNKHWFVNNALAEYSDWHGTYEDSQNRNSIIVECAQLNSGDMLFNSKIGFNVITNRVSKDGRTYFHLKRAGYEWDQGTSHYLGLNIMYPQKAIVYTPRTRRPEKWAALFLEPE